MSDVRVVVNRREVQRLAHHPEVEDAEERIAGQVAGIASLLAPKLSGEGAASIHGEQQSDGTWRVSWDELHYYMFFQEVGTEKMEPNPFLRPAADQFR